MTGSAAPSSSPSASRPSSPGASGAAPGPSAPNGSGSGSGTGGSGSGGAGSGGTGSGGTGGEPGRPTAPAPPSQEAPAGGSDGFPYDGDLCATDHGPYLQVGGRGQGHAINLSVREGHFECHDGDGPEDAVWVPTGTYHAMGVEDSAHITVTAPFVPPGTRRAMTVGELFRRYDQLSGQQRKLLVFHYQTAGDDLIWIFNQIDRP
ncbi:hypothetical protein ACWGI8_37785 [Streptomyces sp. NPDC054841]